MWKFVQTWWPMLSVTVVLSAVTITARYQATQAKKR
jgi:hypothetical protein